MKVVLRNKSLLAVIIVTVCAGFLLIWQIAENLNNNAKQSLRDQVRTVAQSINPQRLKMLSGKATDVDLPDYARIKQQLYNIRTTNDACKFLYILAYNKNNNDVYFFIDSQSMDSEDYAPPGLVYDEVTDEFRAAVKAGVETFVGPVTDRWGTIVTAMAPLHHPDTGEVIAMLGMDVEADEWHTYIAGLSVMPISLTILATILLILTVFLKIKTNELHESVSIDSLTKLSSRKAILEQAEIELSRSVRSNEYFSIIIVDVDNFKKINDEYGHQSGDVVLKQIARCLRESIRHTDYAGRVGGEEFLILMPCSSEKDAKAIAEKLRVSVASLSFKLNKNTLLSDVTASIGVCSRSESIESFEEMFDIADKALYTSKRDGKNKVTVLDA